MDLACPNYFAVDAARPAVCDDNTWDNVALLDKFLRGEIAAVTSYELALARVDGPLHRGVLMRCRDSHRKRSLILRELVKRYGAAPSRTAGPWGWFARAVETGAALLGEDTALRALHEGELHGLKSYLADVERLTGPAFRVVKTQVLPEQRITSDALTQLARR